jgi:hypothetical protein
MRWNGYALPGVLFLFVLCFGFSKPGQAQDDFLTRLEVDEIRDAQEADKRIALYMEIAQRRLDLIKTAFTEKARGAGRTAQKNLRDYTAILEAVEDTLTDGREDRTLREKPLKEAEKRQAEFLTYLRALDSTEAPGYDDYRFTLEEAIDVTEELLANVRQGTFPEVQQRQPPRLPSAPPRETQAAPPRDSQPPRQTGDEEGPPRRRRPSR